MWKKEKRITNDLYKKTLNKVDVEGKKEILRLDLNVSMSHDQILDNNRIKAVLPTIPYLLAKNSKIIILSHLGRVKNNDDKESPDKSLEVVYLTIKTRQSMLYGHSLAHRTTWLRSAYWYSDSPTLKKTFYNVKTMLNLSELFQKEQKQM